MMPSASPMVKPAWIWRGDVDSGKRRLARTAATYCSNASIRLVSAMLLEKDLEARHHHAGIANRRRFGLRGNKIITRKRPPFCQGVGGKGSSSARSKLMRR